MSAPRTGEPQAEGARGGGVAAQAKISVHDLNFFYGTTQALFNISLPIPERVVMAFIGPSGCGKSTFLRTLNRMNDTIPGARATGEVLIDGEDIYAPGLNVVNLRRRVGMVFQIPALFGVSVEEAVLYGARLAGRNADPGRLLELVGLNPSLAGRNPKRA